MPLRALEIFNLPQDSVAYEGRRREDLATRCKSRAGWFISDFMYIVEDYRADIDGEARAKLEAEIAALKGEKKRVGVSFSELEKRASNLANANTTLSRKVGEMEVTEQTLSNKVQELKGRLQEVETERDGERTKRKSLDRQVEGMNNSYKLIVEKNENLKREVQKGVEEIFDALGDGYGRCVCRIAEAGFNVEGHAFEDYLQNLASSKGGDS
ncbi:uncharacterized protein LOC141663746 [Apium graveolens]|uniref:uncharacterized protein LOC141663746 n=1 Tax=Apium graveolens TaxID=4045 RepID=UPI003D791BC2